MLSPSYSVNVPASDRYARKTKTTSVLSQLTFFTKWQDGDGTELRSSHPAVWTSSDRLHVTCSSCPLWQMLTPEQCSAKVHIWMQSNGERPNRVRNLSLATKRSGQIVYCSSFVSADANSLPLASPTVIHNMADTSSCRWCILFYVLQHLGLKREFSVNKETNKQPNYLLKNKQPSKGQNNQANYQTIGQANRETNKGTHTVKSNAHCEDILWTFLRVITWYYRVILSSECWKLLPFLTPR